MVLENKDLEYGLLPVDAHQGSLFTLVSSPTGLLTFDQKLGDYRELKDGELPKNSDGLILIQKESNNNSQTQVSLSTGYTKNCYPHVYSTTIIKGSLSSLSTDGYILMTDQWVECGYSWKLILYPDKLELRKFDLVNWSPADFDYTKDKYISINIPHNFVGGDELVCGLRFTENNDIVGNPTNFMELDLKVNDELKTSVSRSFNCNMTSIGILNFYDLDNQFESEFLLRSCTRVFERLTDPEMETLFTDTTEIDTKVEENTQERSQSFSLKRKTVCLKMGTTGTDLIHNNEVPDDKQVFLHGMQVRSKMSVGGELFTKTMILRNNNSVILFTFKGLYNGSNYVIPNGGFWDLNTSNMGPEGYGPWGFNEDGNLQGIGLNFHIDVVHNQDLLITLYYTIE